MFEHHRESIGKLLEYFRSEPGILAIVLGGSVAKGCARPDSDLDAIVVVTEERFARLEQEGRLSECIFGHCTYENGYFDVKYCTEHYLRTLAERGSEPSRNAFLSCQCLYTAKPELEEILRKIPVFQKQEQQDKLLSFYSAFQLNSGYFWNSSQENPYLRTRAVADLVLFGLRLLLEENEVLFPCHKALFQTVSGLGYDGILEKAYNFLADPKDAAKEEYTSALLNALHYQPPEDYSAVLTRYVDDNEQWWYKQRPVISEW